MEEKKLSGQHKIFDSSTIGKGVIQFLEKEYEVKIGPIFRMEVSYKGDYKKVKKFSLDCCD